MPIIVMKAFLLALLAALPTFAFAQSSSVNPSDAAGAATQVPVTLTGGYETDPRDRGRPVVLIAAALNVSSEVFRDAFTHVKPAPAGQQPEPDQVRKNKQALVSALGPYGVTDDRLNTVSNYYRYNRSRGEMWRHVPAVAFATVRNGLVTGFTITDPGSGYSSTPQVSLPGMANLNIKVTLSYGTDLAKNGSVQNIALAADPAKP
jgi:hypothetical protein